MTYAPLKLTEDYDIIKELFEESPMKVAPHIAQLPTNGVVVKNKEGHIVGCLFLYLMSNANGAIVAYPLLSNDIVDFRSGIIKEMYCYLEFLASTLGYNTMNTWSGLPHVMSNLKESGYVEADQNVSHFIKGI